jgi:hypothetical protein
MAECAAVAVLMTPVADERQAYVGYAAYDVHRSEDGCQQGGGYQYPFEIATEHMGLSYPEHAERCDKGARTVAAVQKGR